MRRVHLLGPALRMYRDVAKVVHDVAHLSLGDTKEHEMDSAIRVAHLHRIAQLMETVSILVDQDQPAASALILNRCITESVVGLLLLLRHGDADMFRCFVAISGFLLS